MRHDIESYDQGGEDQDMTWLDGPVVSCWVPQLGVPKLRWKTTRHPPQKQIKHQPTPFKGKNQLKRPTGKKPPLLGLQQDM
jgi:hypothetical protein